jgi:hypothetical protein
VVDLENTSLGQALNEYGAIPIVKEKKGAKCFQKNRTIICKSKEARIERKSS